MNIKYMHIGIYYIVMYNSSNGLIEFGSRKNVIN